MVRTSTFLYNLPLPLRSDDQMSFKLEYLSAGTNHPDAFTISVNPLIFSYALSVFLLELLTNAFFPQTSWWLVTVPPVSLFLPPSAMKKKELPPDPGSHSRV